MSEAPKSEPKGWWQTLPGLLTAAAGIITAITGLLVALHQTGLFDHTTHPTVQTQTHSKSRRTSRPANSGKPHNLPPTGPPRKLRSKIRPGRLQTPVGPHRSLLAGKVSLHLTVRMTNNDRFDANFWAASFRLLVDGSLQSPENNLDELVSAHSAKEGDVEFIIPSNISTVGLQMGDVGEGKPTTPINLHKAPTINEQNAHLTDSLA